MPEFAAVKNLEQSINELLYGNPESQYANYQYKFWHKWQNSPYNLLQNDYEKVLSSLFAKSAKRNEDYVRLCQLDEGNEKLPIPKSVIEILRICLKTQDFAYEIH